LTFLLNEEFWKNENLKALLIFLITLNLVVIVIFMVACHFIQQNNFGSLSNQIVFFNDRIICCGREITITQIERIDFRFGHYNKQYRSFRASDIRPRLSNGNDNVIMLTLKNDELITYYFHLSNSEEFLSKMYDLLISYHLNGIVPFLKLIEYLNITDYQKIQEFKKIIYSNKV
jgi:hypothetical protein